MSKKKIPKIHHQIMMKPRDISLHKNVKQRGKRRTYHIQRW
jgi:hypothetical protein